MTYRNIDPNRLDTRNNLKSLLGVTSFKNLIRRTIVLGALFLLLVTLLTDEAESFEPQDLSSLYQTNQNPSSIPEGLACPKPAEKSIERFEPLGPLYEISEPNLLELFLKRLKAMQENGSYEKHFNDNKALIGNLLQNPPAVKGLDKSYQERTWLLTASIPENLPDELLRQAQQVELPKISRELLFIDGTDQASIESARMLYTKFPDMRVVLTAGSPAEVSKALDKRIFFDQGGGLVRVFGIEAVPAILFNSANGPAGLEFPAADTELILEKYFPTASLQASYLPSFLTPFLTFVR